MYIFLSANMFRKPTPVNPIPHELWKDVITRVWAIMAHIKKVGFNTCKIATNWSKIVFKYIIGSLSYHSNQKQSLMLYFLTHRIILESYTVLVPIKVALD